MTDKEKIAKVMELAFSYVGTKEEPPNSNNVCFNTRYYGREVSGSNYPWCMAFLWSLFDEAGLSKEFGKKTASCTTFRDSNKDKIITKGFKRGDIILYNFNSKSIDPFTSTCYHCGICVSTTSTTITTIEGNTSVESNDNGGSVMKRIRMRDWVVCGVRLIGEMNPVKYQSAALPILKNGHTMQAVKALQGALNAIGYECGDCDGIYGTKTEAAVRKLQGDTGIYIDGECGKDTYGKIFKDC